MFERERVRRIKVISSADSIVAILLMVVGILMILAGFFLMDTIVTAFSYYMYFLSSFGSSPYGSTSLPFWYYVPFWVMIVSGITLIIYGLKKLLDDILRFAIVNN